VYVTAPADVGAATGILYSTYSKYIPPLMFVCWVLSLLPGFLKIEEILLE
jgi:hypothetical protein